MKATRHEKNVKALSAFIIFLLAAAVFFMFNSNQSNLMANDSIKLYMVLAIVACGFLIAMLYLTQNSQITRSSHHAATKKKAKRKNS